MLFFAFFRRAKKKDRTCFSCWRGRSRKRKGKRGKRKRELGRERNLPFIRTFPPPLPIFCVCTLPSKRSFALSRNPTLVGKERRDEALRTSARQASVCHAGYRNVFSSNSHIKKLNPKRGLVDSGWQRFIQSGRNFRSIKSSVF